MEKYKITVDVLGDSYALKSDCEEHTVKKIAQDVDVLMRNISQANPGLSPAKIAVLAALNIMEEYLKLQQDYNNLLDIVKEEKKAW